MDRVIRVTDCLNCPYVLYFSDDHYRCGNVSGTKLLNIDEVGIPDWCPLEKEEGIM